MNTKLTLRLDEGRIEQAKAYAARRGVSVSQLVSDYFALLDDAVEPGHLSPRVTSLLGSVPGDGDLDDYGAYLESKYR